MIIFFYQKYIQGHIDFVITSLVSKEIVLKQYKIGLSYKEYLPIEELPETEKEQLRNQCRETGVTFTNRELRNACRIIYTLKKIDS